MSNDDLQWLRSINFHFLLGYARNLRSLRDGGLTDSPQTIEVLRSLIKTENDFVSFIAPWLRIAEWNLRSLTIKHFCGPLGHGEGFLDVDGWVSHYPGDCERIQSKMLDAIRRHGEPYTVDFLEKSARRLGIEVPDYYGAENHDTWIQLTKELPFWAAIDSFSVGTLGKFIMQCNGVSCRESGDDNSQPLWKAISQELGISNSKFSINVDAFGVFRNLVFHHQRIWMRPMPKSPGIPKELDKKYRDYKLKGKNREAHLVVLLAISKFMPHFERERYQNELLSFLERDPLFAMGITTSPFT